MNFFVLMPEPAAPFPGFYGVRASASSIRRAWIPGVPDPQSYTTCCRVSGTHLEVKSAKAVSPRDPRLAAPAAMSKIE